MANDIDFRNENDIKLHNILDLILKKRELIKEEYKLLNDLEKEMIKLLYANNYKFVYHNEHKVTLKYYIDRIVDYDKMRKLYPKVYQDGLIETFSKEEAVRLNDVNLIGEILQHCMIKTPVQKLKYERKGSYKR